MSKPLPTPATRGEELVVDACGGDSFANLAVVGDDQRRVRSNFLRAILLAHQSNRRFGVGGAIVDGSLDLRFLTLERGVTLRTCTLDSINAIDLVAPFLDLSGSTITGRGDASEADPPALNLAGARLGGLYAGGLHSEGHLLLADAHVDGLVELELAVIRAPARSLIATRIRVTGSVIASEADFDGGVSLRGADVAGDVEVGQVIRVGAASSARHQYALSLEGARIGGRLTLSGPLRAHGLVDLSSITVGQDVVVRGSKLRPWPVETAAAATPASGLRLDRATVGGSVLIRDGFVADGPVSMTSSNIRGDVDCTDAEIRNLGGSALALDHAEIGGNVRLGAARGPWGSSEPDSVIGDHSAAPSAGFRATGTVRILRAHIAGNLNCWGLRVDAPAENSIVADNVTVDGSVYFRPASTASPDRERIDIPCELHGTVRMVNARVGGHFDCSGARFTASPSAEHPNRSRSINLTNASIGGDVLLRDSFHSAGLVDLFGAEVRGLLSLVGGTLTAAQGSGDDRALRAGSMTVGSLALRNAAFDEHSLVSLSGLTVRDALIDDESSWPKRFALDGMTYRRIDGRTTPAARVRQLHEALDRTEGFRPGPYTQLANAYRSVGDDRSARMTLIARERHRGRSLPSTRRFYRAAHHLWGTTVRYGYEPWRALIWLALVITAGSLIFLPQWMVASSPSGNSTQYWSGWYAADIALPLVDLQQASTWTPDTTVLTMAMSVVTILGWVLSGAFIAALAAVTGRPEGG